MRRFSLFFLLATAAAAPLAAQDRGGRHHGNDSSEQSSEQSDSRPHHVNQNRSSEPREQRSVTVQRSSGGGDAGQTGAIDRVREYYRQQHQQSATTQSDGNETALTGGRGDGAAGSQTQSQSQTNWRERERHVRTIPDTQPVATTQSGNNVARTFEGRHRRDYRDGNYTRWSDNWRHDRRYNWYSYRNQHRSIFRLGSYYDPFGWGYRSWSIGSLLYPSYYGSNFWLNDPWQYRLPPAYGPYRWVRYWNDALLVNIYTGQVVDVMHGFFW